MKKIAVIVPSFNEEATVGAVIRGSVDAIRSLGLEGTVFVIDDGSADLTVERAESAGATVVRHEANAGVGRAFRTGLEQALAWGADFVANIDADGQFEPRNLRLLIDPLIKGTADFAVGSRFKKGAVAPPMPWTKRLGNFLVSRLVSGITGRRIWDVSCGFRAYNREAALRMSLDCDFTYTHESIIDLLAKGMRLAEIPVRVRARQGGGESRVARSLFQYARESAAAIMHVSRDLWPQAFFGSLTLLAALPGIALLAFLAIHRVRSGVFSPHIWAGFVGGAFLFLAVILLALGTLAEILKRIRMNQETLLYWQRRRHFGREPEQP